MVDTVFTRPQPRDNFHRCRCRFGNHAHVRHFPYGFSPCGRSDKGSGQCRGTNFLFGFITKNASRMPFVANSIGNYYLEAMNDGATTGQATAYAIPAGLRRLP